MLLSLPTELVEHIVRLAIPSTPFSTTYAERQKALTSLCLVCRQLKPVAQAVLQEVVRLKRPGLAGSQVSVNGATVLRDVRFHQLEDKVDLSLLESLVFLDCLTVTACSVTSSLFRLQSVTQLTWVRSTFSTTIRPRPFTLAHFPHLRHLLFWMEDYTGSEGAWAPEVAASDVAHLDTLVISQPLAASSYTSLLPAVLVDVGLSERCTASILTALQNGAHHVRLFDQFSLEVTVSLDEVFSSFSSRFCAADFPWTDFKLLYLPTAFRPSTTHLNALSESVETLLDFCASRGIAVEFEDTDEGPNGTLTSPRFELYAKALEKQKD
ncbi:hypothetical protein JCM6882_001358 [Rhodosporidiobolus microsporus]